MTELSQMLIAKKPSPCPLPEGEGRRPPPGRPIVRMAWRDLLFLHWPVDANTVQRLLPAGLEIDTYDGSAWVGLIPFRMPVVRAFGLTIPGAGSVLECNVRTYVRCGIETGVWFFSLDANSISAVYSARTIFRLNYRHSRISTNRDSDRFEYVVERRDHHRRSHIGQRSARSSNGGDSQQPAMRCVWDIGAAMPSAKPGELEHFLTERYALFTIGRGGRLLVSRIHHESWRLREARIVELNDSLIEAAGVDIGGARASEPTAFHCDAVDALAWRLGRVCAS